MLFLAIPLVHWFYCFFFFFFILFYFFFLRFFWFIGSFFFFFFFSSSSSSGNSPGIFFSCFSNSCFAFSKSPTCLVSKEIRSKLPLCCCFSLVRFWWAV